ncbi:MULTISPECIES: hypothetical protein [Enterococcus]|uniref:hypothetical protein n=1 Tax=Enterococcus TaxID=1350 RepID=UPI000ECDE238|nr:MULTISPECIES: hypothetical protein [Enterococcus]BBM16985.1 hypothetical protein G15_0626 [Enterococcus avium]HCM85001.1 hypothetical protein [Enterococcus sp.]
MNEQLLTNRQLFNLKPKTLENRITQFYQRTQNSSLTIKYILALRVRYQLGAEEFADILRDLVRDIFMNTKATRTMKRFFYYFQDYFMAPEWRSLRLRLFTIRSFGEKVLSVFHSLFSIARPDETNEP